MPVPPSLEDLVQAICQGKPIDWESLEQDASPGLHNRLAALRVVEGIARVHRTTERDESGPADAPAAAAPAARWGHLELLEHIASGAFGDVYRAWDSGLDREVALKLLRRSADAAADADETLEEGRLLARVRHPNVVTVYGAARFDGRAGIWMEFVRGRTLADVVAQEGPLPPARVTSIGMALCHALSAVHGASLVHRDVKAQNVMIGDDGRIALMDFGAGSAVRHAGLQRAGTPRYLAPEVAAGGPATVQSDIYSLGVMLRYLLTAAFDARPGVMPGRAAHRLQTVLARAMNARPDERFESADAFAHALASSVKRPRNLVGIGVAIALVTGLLVILWTTTQSGNLEESRRRAFEQSWQGAIPTRAPTTVDRFQAGFGGAFSFRGVVPAISGDERHGSLVTFDPSSGDSRVWLTYSGEGHVGSTVVSRDGSLMAYTWVDTACRCVSLRTVDRNGQVRRLASAPGIIDIWIGDITTRRLVILTAREFMRFELGVVDIDTGVTRVLRTVLSEPSGLSLSPDGRFVAFDMPRQSEAGSPRDIIVHEIPTGLEWPLLDRAGDRALAVWSPHGDQLFYIETAEGSTTLRATKVVDGRGSSRPAVLRRDIGRPIGIGFLDDNTFAYFIDASRSDVRVVDAGAAGFRGQKARWIGAGANTPALSPDGRWLAWSDYPTRRGGIRVTATDGRVVRGFQTSLGWQMNPVWSDDSKQLAFWDVGRFGALLKVASLESGPTREVLRRTHRGWDALYTLAWMPGGHELLLTPDRTHVVAVDIDTGRQREIHASPPGESLGGIFVSPDGQSLAFCEGPVEGHQDQQAPIHILPLGAHGRSLSRPASAALGEALIGWWPDGSLLEIRNAAGGMPNLYDLWRLPLDGTSPEPLGVTGPGILYASASTDAKRLAYSTETWGQELWLLKPVAPQ
jgi:serine/threonine protein kinase/Tol biopolymer transport system component